MAKQQGTIVKFLSVSNQTRRGPSVPNGEANGRPKPQGDQGARVMPLIQSVIRGPDQGNGAGKG